MTDQSDILCQRGLSPRVFATAVAAVCATAWAVPASAQSPAPRPNIVFFFADDLGIADVGAFGQQDILTPNIDRLANQGMVFRNMYSAGTVCTPSRCGLMTGFHGGHMTADRNGGPTGGDYPLRPEDITVGEVLKTAGYTNGFYGKWGMGPCNKDKPNPALIVSDLDTLPTRQGFDEMYGYLNQVRAHSYLVPYLWQDDASAPEGVSLAATNGVYTHDLIAGRAAQFVADHAADPNPFYLQASFTPPHSDIDAVPQQWKDLYADRGWETKKVNLAAMITHLDATVGEVIARIEDPDGDGNTADSIAGNTLMIFASDNGPHQSDGAKVSFFNSNGPYKGYKRDLFDGGIRTPMIARWDGVLTPGSENDYLGSLDGFLATAAELAGVDAPVGVDGTSFASILSGGERPEDRDFLIWTHHEGGGGVSGSNAPRWAIRKDDWKLIKMEDGTYRLYDLANDIGESSNIVGDHPQVKAELEAIALAEKVETPNGYWVQHRTWTGGGDGSTWDQAGNWSGSGSPADNWIPTLDNAAPTAARSNVAASSAVLGVEVRGSGSEMRVDVARGKTLTARNGLRVEAGGRMHLTDAALSTVRDVDIRGGGALTGDGDVEGEVANAGLVSPGQDGFIEAPPAPEDVRTGVIRALEFDFTGVQDDAPLTATSVQSEYLTLESGFDYGAGVMPRWTDGGSTNRGDEFDVSGFTTASLAAAITNDDYFFFSVAPVPGVAMTLDSVSVNLWRNGVNAAKNYAFLTGQEGFADGSQLGSIAFSTIGDANQVLFTADYTGGQAVTDVLEVRLYGWNSSNMGNTHINAVSMDASFVSIPGEPLRPLGPSGVLTLQGDYRQLADGALAIDVGRGEHPDPDLPLHDTLEVVGDVELAGSLLLSWLLTPDDPNSKFGGPYDVLTYTGSRSGHFDTLGGELEAYVADVDYAADLGDGRLAVRVALHDLLIGDADLNGAVTYGDLAALTAAMGGAGDWRSGDFNFDGWVDHRDYLILKENLGLHLPGVSIPEPATLGLLALGALAMLRRRRPSRSS